MAQKDNFDLIHIKGTDREKVAVSSFRNHDNLETKVAENKSESRPYVGIILAARPEVKKKLTRIKKPLAYRKPYVIMLLEEDEVMLTVNYTTLRDNMKTYMDQVTDEYETLVVTRRDNKNIIMISEEKYNNLIKTLPVCCTID